MQNATGLAGNNRIIQDLSDSAVATAQNLVLLPMAVTTLKGGRNKGARRGRARTRTHRE
jgi:hypothetical protein